MSLKSSSKIPQYGKLDIEECVKNFRISVLNNLNDMPRLKTDLITSGKLSHFYKTSIRAFSWKFYLNILTTNEKSSLKVWIDETLTQRKNVKKMIRSNTINKLKGDPLGGLTSNSNSNSEQKEKNTDHAIFTGYAPTMTRTTANNNMIKIQNIRHIEESKKPKLIKK